MEVVIKAAELSKTFHVFVYQCFSSNRVKVYRSPGTVSLGQFISVIIKNRTKIDTQVYGLLLHFQSHTDKRYKDCLLKTMIHRAYALSSTTEAFDQECTRLRSIFTRLDYPLAMINSIITKTIQSLSFGTREKNKEDSSVVRVIVPFKDQTSANAVRRQMRDLSYKIGTTLQPVFTSRKLEQDLKPSEIKPPIVNQQCVVYSFTCDLCDSDYVGFTARHLHQLIAEHKYSAIGKHFSTVHGDTSLLKESQFRILKKCQGKFDCLVYEMLFIKERNPSLNTQTDSIRAKLFV